MPDTKPRNENERCLDGVNRAAFHRPVDFLFIGAQKAGSTWLYQALASHPDIYLAEGVDDKDTQFFSYHYDRGYEWYERFYLDGQNARMRGEVSTSYFPCHDTPQRIAQYKPDAKLLLCLRNPVDRIISNHKHELRLEHISPSKIGLAEGLENNPYYVEQSRYHMHLTRWLEYFPLESFHILIFEELFSDPLSSIRSVYEYLGVDPGFSPPSLHVEVNQTRIPQNQALDRALRKAATTIRLGGLGWFIDALKQLGLKKLVEAGNSMRFEPDEIDLRTISMLREMFREENEKLERLLGRDLKIWNR